jgi:hypothetical protein
MKKVQNDEFKQKIVTGIVESYKQMTAGFEKELEERTVDEVAYDNIIIEELRKGRSIKKALKTAAEKYPNEALQYDDETIGDIESHYDYLLNHEAIKNRIKIG